MTGEFDFLNALRKIALHPAARGLDDDAAVLEFGSEALVLTHDTMAEGVHYLPDADMADVAYKLAAVNLSDLAAKGAEPIGVLLGYSLGRDDERFLEGLKEALQEFGVPLLGGDTIRANGPRSFGMTALGRASHTPVPARSGAKPGDDVLMCGTIGDAYAGFHSLTAPERAKAMGMPLPASYRPDPYFAGKFLRPTPLLSQGAALAPFVTTMMDISDGLFIDAARIAAASNVTLSLNLDDVAHSREFRIFAADGNQLDVMSEGWATRKAACAWGDDYALLFTAPAGTRLPIEVSHIGTVKKAGKHPLLIDDQPPKPDDRLGYSHD